MISASTSARVAGSRSAPRTALVTVREPVNKSRDFVRCTAQHLKALCPMLGKAKIAEMLCRAGLHLRTTTVGLIPKEPTRPEPSKATNSTGCMVTTKRPNHVWHVDLTTVPIGAGFWAPWPPLALPQCWPFCWWLAVPVDHYSRRAMGFSVFPQRPTSLAVRSFLGRIIARANRTPKYPVCDKDSSFWCEEFKRWCRRKRIHPRYGAVGQHESIALIERFIRTVKDEATRRILVPQRRSTFARELTHFFTWYNAYRPHAALGGSTPNEVYFRLRPANRRPRLEPGRRWPRNSPCARPRTLTAVQPGDRFTLEVDFHGGAQHLPVVSLKRFV